jgi:hypothetical protein
MSMHPPMMDKLAASRVDDMRRAAEGPRNFPRERARLHPGATIARGVGVTLIRMGRRLAGPDVRNEPRILTPRDPMGELHTLR